MIKGTIKKFEDRKFKSNWKIIKYLGIKPIGKVNRNRPFVIAECPFCKKHMERMLYSIREGGSKSCGCLKSVSAKVRGQNQRTPEGHYVSIYKRYIKSARARGYEFNLTEEETVKLFKDNCHYCGESPSNRTGKQIGKIVPTNGIDRKDNSIGYSIDNCVPCCKYCNKMKLYHSYEDFTSHILKIANNLKKEN